MSCQFKKIYGPSIKIILCKIPHSNWKKNKHAQILGSGTFKLPSSVKFNSQIVKISFLFCTWRVCCSSDFHEFLLVIPLGKSLTKNAYWYHVTITVFDIIGDKRGNFKINLMVLLNCPHRSSLILRIGKTYPVEEISQHSTSAINSKKRKTNQNWMEKNSIYTGIM
jgi:hypothetical protein